MNCPVDKSPMLVVEHNKIELDYCPSCHGVWFDAGELGLLMATLGMSDAADVMGEAGSNRVQTAEKPRRCPICREPMRKTTVGDRPQILIDACPREHGLWFDGGELGQFLNEVADKEPAGHAAHRHVAGFLKGALQAHPRATKS